MLGSFPELPLEQGLREVVGSARTLPRTPLRPPGAGGSADHCPPSLQHPDIRPKLQHNTRPYHLRPPLHGLPLHPAIPAAPRPPTPTLQKPVHFCSRKSGGKLSQEGDLTGEGGDGGGAGPTAASSPPGHTVRYPSPPRWADRLREPACSQPGSASPSPSTRRCLCSRRPDGLYSAEARGAP